MLPLYVFNSKSLLLPDSRAAAVAAVTGGEEAATTVKLKWTEQRRCDEAGMDRE